MRHHVTATTVRSAPRPLLQALDPGWQLWADQWTRHLTARRLSPATIASYLHTLRRFVTWATPRELEGPDDCTPGLLEEYLAERASQAAAATVHQDYRQLRVFFSWYADAEDVAHPMAKIVAPKVGAHRIPLLTDDELSRLLAAAAGKSFPARRDTAILRLLLDCGLRRSELLGLRVTNLDLASQCVLVHGKGDRPRVVPYGARTAEAIDAYLRSRARHVDRHLDEFWLADKPHRGPLGETGIRLMLLRRARAAGVPNVFPHRFRHTAASAWLAAGGTEGDAMQVFGWKSRSMLDRYGSAAAEQRAISAARRLSPGDRI